MRVALPRWVWMPCCILAGTAGQPALAEDRQRPDLPSEPPTEWRWSLGTQLKLNDLGQASLHPMIGFRYGRWRSGAVDGESWHRFGQVKTDNTLTYDLLPSDHWRTSLSAGIVNMQRDSNFDALLPGRKTLRGRATIDYLGWPHWSVGLSLNQDMLGRGAGTSVSPSLTYRQPLSQDSTILLTHTFTWTRSDLWRYKPDLDPAIDPNQPSHWGRTMDTSLTLRQRWRPHWSWFAQLGRSQILRAGDPLAQPGTHWAGQMGIVYFER